jgi:PAS domain S-box-containing protein
MDSEKEEKVKKRTDKLNKSLEELRNTVTLLSAITNLSSDVIYVKDRQSRWIFANPALERIIGRTADKLLGKNDLEIYSNPEIGKTILENDRRIMDSGKEEILEEIFETPEGMRSFISVKTPRFNDNGQIIGIVGISHDITEHKNTEKELKLSEEKYRLLYSTMKEGVALHEIVYNLQQEAVDYIITDVNPAYEEITGLKRSEVEGKRASKLYGTGSPPYMEIYASVAENRKPRQFETYFEPMDKYFRIAITSPEKGKFATFFEDITDRKKVEDSLRESEERFEDLANNIPNLAWMAEANGWIFWYNKQWFEYTGTTLEEMQGWGWQKIHHPDYIKSVTEEWTTKIKEEKPYDNIFPLKGKDGNYRWFLTRVTPIRDKQGKLIRWFGTNTDITKRKLAEDRNQKLLEHEQQLTEELQSSNEELQQKEKDMAQLYTVLRKSEKSVRLKLETILSPEGNIGKLDLSDILDVKAIQSLMDNYYKTFQLPMAMIDTKGEVLAGVGWQDICTQFHRVNPETKKHCIESDIELTIGVPKGEFKLYKCKNNMWDIATPIIVSGKHLGNIFSGQFFFEDEELDYELFRKQAKKYDFDVEKYISALEAAPKVSRQAVNEGMAFFIELADMISRMSYSNLNLARSLTERNKLLENEQQLIEELQTSNEELQSTSLELRVANEDLQNQHEILFSVNQNLHNNQEKFSKAFNANPAAMTLSDEKGKFVDVNESYSKLTGYNKDELIGHTSAELNIMDSKKLNQHMNESQEVGSINDTEFEIRRKSGEKRVITNSRELIQLKNKINFITFSYDITERKNAEEKLKETFKTVSQLNRTLVALRNSSFAMMHAVDEDYYLDEVCRIIVEDCGHSMVWIGLNEEMSKKVIPVAYAGFEEDYLKTLNITWDNTDLGQGPTGTAIRTGKPYICENMQIDPKFKPWREEAIKRGYASSIVLPLSLDDKVFGALNIYSKETSPFSKEEKKLLNELANDISYGITFLRLRNAHTKAENDLREGLIEVERSNAELEQFAYVTSHDLREPLRMITSFLQLLERRYKDQLDEDANEFIGFAVDGAKRLDAMINDILIYSRVANKERTLTNINLNKTLEEVYLNLKTSIEETNAEITHDQLPTLVVDGQLMIQLFQNLIGNAIKYRSKKTPKIHISAEKEDKKWLFSVKDNGIGISHKHLERIFTIFQRLHSKEEYEGTGIGLSIVQKIVHQHHGQIWVQSESGKGSTFYFTIPIKS